jgi:hypothetical protein
MVSLFILAKKQPTVDKNPDGHIMIGSATVVIREISKSTGIAQIFKIRCYFPCSEGISGPPAFG